MSKNKCEWITIIIGYSSLFYFKKLYNDNKK